VTYRRLLLAGLALEAIYLAAVLGPFSFLAHGAELTDLGKLTDHQPIAAVAVTVAIGVLFGLYGLALRAASHSKGDSRTVDLAIGLSALQSLTLVFLYPIMASDLYIYAVDAYAAAFYKLNLLVTAPIAAGNDPFFAYARDWAQLPSPYGPLWLTLSKLVALAAGPNVVVAVLLLKLLGALAVLATTLLLVRALAKRGRRAQLLAVILFGWNPLVQIELVGNGHNDAVLTLLVVAGLIALTSRRSALGMLGIAGALLIKILPVGVVPLCLLAVYVGTHGSSWRRLLRLGASAAVFVVVVVVAYAPFWAGPVTLMRIRQADGDYLASISALVVAYFPDATNWLAYPRTVLAGAIVLWLAYALWTRRLTLEVAAFEALFATILLSAHFSGWYLALLVATATLTHDRRRQERVAIFCVTAMLTTSIWTYLWVWLQGWNIATPFLSGVVPFTFLPPLLLTFPTSARFVDSLVERVKNAWRPLLQPAFATAAPSIPQPLSPTRGESGAG
jgi:hypothetical protein